MFWILIFTAATTLSFAIYFLKYSISLMFKIAISVYLINFFIGHVLLLSYRLIFKPNSYILLGDIRLLNINIDIKFLLFLNLLQLVFVSVGVFIAKSAKSAKRFLEREDFPEDLNRALLLTTFIGWIGNLAGIRGNVNLFSAFHPFELLGTAWLVSGFRLKRLGQPVVFILAMFHLIWAVLLFRSKSETFLILVALIVRLLHSETKIKLSQISLISITAYILFPFIQVQKGILTISKVQELLVSQNESFSFLKALGIGFLQRFDGADSITDAYTAGAGSWYGLFEYSKLILIKMIPNISFLIGNFFGEDTATASSLGQLWNDQMRPLSIRNITYGVPVTFGPMAEGYSIDGMSFGLIMCIIFGVLMVIFCSSCYSKKLFPTVCGLYFIFHLENLQNSVGHLVLMVPKMLQCYILIKVCFVIVTPRNPRKYLESNKKPSGN